MNPPNKISSSPRRTFCAVVACIMVAPAVLCVWTAIDNINSMPAAAFAGLACFCGIVARILQAEAHR